MITGSVTPEKEARVSLTVRGPNGSGVRASAVIDTGFNGSLTLPLSVIRQLGLPLRAPRQATLADGSVVVLEVYKGHIAWNGEARNILVFAAEGDALIGMALLQGHVLRIEVVDGGTVHIEPLR